MNTIKQNYSQKIPFLLLLLIFLLISCKSNRDIKQDVIDLSIYKTEYLKAKTSYEERLSNNSYKDTVRLRKDKANLKRAYERYKSLEYAIYIDSIAITKPLPPNHGLSEEKIISAFNYYINRNLGTDRAYNIDPKKTYLENLDNARKTNRDAVNKARTNKTTSSEF